MAIDPKKLPRALGADVARVLPGGFPTSELLDQELRQIEYLKRNDTDLQTQIVSISGAVGTLSGHVDDVASVVANPDGSLTAQRLSTVSAQSATTTGKVTDLTQVVANPDGTITAGKLTAVSATASTGAANALDAAANALDALSVVANPNGTLTAQKLSSVATQSALNAGSVTDLIGVVQEPNGTLTAGKLTSVSATASTGAANASSALSAVSNPDGTVTAGKLTSVSARADAGTASGNIKFVAISAPTGYSAAFDLQLAAGSASTGLTLLADGSGVGSIALKANQLRMTDPSYNGGVPGNVFNYATGLFTFGVPVSVRTSDIAPNAVSQVITASSGGGSASATITCRGGQIRIIANYKGNSSVEVVNSNSNIAPPFPTVGRLTLKRNGAELTGQDNNVRVYYMYRDFRSSSFGVTYVAEVHSSQLQTLITIVDSPGAGTFTYEISDNQDGGLFIELTELVR